MFAIVHSSWRLLGQSEKRRLFLFMVGRVFLNFLDVFGLAAVGLLAFVLVSGQPEHEFFVALQLRENHLIIVLVVVVATAFVVKAAVGGTLVRGLLRFLARIESDFSNKIGADIFSGKLHSFRAKSRQEIEFAILRSTNVAISGILGQAANVLADLSLALFIFAFLIFADWRVAIAMLVYIILFLLSFQAFARKSIEKAGSDLGKGSISVHEAISNLSVAYREISVAGVLAVFLSSLADSRVKVANAGAYMGFVSVIPRLLMEVAVVVGGLGFLVFQLAFNEGKVDGVIVGIFLLGGVRLLSALLPLHNAVMSFRYDAYSARLGQEMLREILEGGEEWEPSTARIQRTPLEYPAVNARGLGINVEVSDVSFRQDDAPEGAQTLSGVTLSIAAGTTAALIGPSGSGKSTLADIILGLLVPENGRVRLDGFSPQEMVRNAPGKLAYVPQKPGMIRGTIAENIALGVHQSEIDSSLLLQVSSQAGLSELIDRLPEGFHTDLGNHSDSLSGGQIQRLGLARALYTRPSLLVLDEATSALDAETEATISDNLEKLKGKMTLVIIAHRLSTIQEADCVYVLEGGSLVTSGSFSEVRASSDIVNRYISLMSIKQ